MSDINFNIILPSIYNYLPPWSGIRFENLTLFRLVKNLKQLMELKRFITVTIH